MPRVEVLVVGAGIVGLASAYHVSRLCPSCRVVVVEKHRGPGHGDTGRSAAAFRAVFTSSTNMALAASSVAFYRRVQEVEGFNLGMRFLGYLLTVPEGGLERLRPALEGLKRRGLGFRVYSAGELEELLGMRTRVSLDEEARLMGLPDVEAGVLVREAGVMRPERLVDYYHRGCLEAGVEFLFGRRVEGLVVEAEPSLGLRGEPLPWQRARVAGARLEGGETVRADVTIVAAGAEAGFLLEPVGVEPPGRPKKRQVFVVRGPGVGELLHVRGFNEEGVAPFILLPRGVYLRPVPEEAAFWTGASDHLGRPFSWEPEPRPEPWFYEYGLLPVIRAYLPRLGSLRAESGWAGFYDISIDSQPVVHTAPGLVAAGGTSGSGIMKADAIGRIAAAAALGREWAELYGGERFRVEWLGLRGRRVEEEKLVI